jgi:hypothetical protein|eukprot:COSAG01_NODE_3030_length_6698_cov_13.145022_6_plen_56_part_00
MTWSRYLPKGHPSLVRMYCTLSAAQSEAEVRVDGAVKSCPTCLAVIVTRYRMCVR